MSELTTQSGYWLERSLGAAAGSLMALIYFLPKSWQEAASRLATSFACGLVFGPQAGALIAARLDLGGTLSASETMLSGATAAGLLAWWGLGLALRLARRAGGDRLPDTGPAEGDAGGPALPASDKADAADTSQQP